jgi:hypothetical protein
VIIYTFQTSSYEKVITNVQTIIQEWIEVATELNRPIPEPVYGIISAKGLLVEDADNSIKHSNKRQEKISIA